MSLLNKSNCLWEKNLTDPKLLNRSIHNMHAILFCNIFCHSILFIFISDCFFVSFAFIIHSVCFLHDSFFPLSVMSSLSWDLFQSIFFPYNCRIFNTFCMWTDVCRLCVSEVSAQSLWGGGFLSWRRSVRNSRLTSRWKKIKSESWNSKFKWGDVHMPY